LGRRAPICPATKKEEEETMGASKRLMEDQEAEQQRVLSVLEEYGAVEPCPVHEDYLIDQEDPGAVEEAIAALTEEFGDDAERKVRDALGAAFMDCPGCPGPSD
jgi:hypothetical protein